MMDCCLTNLLGVAMQYGVVEPQVLGVLEEFGPIIDRTPISMCVI